MNRTKLSWLRKLARSRNYVVITDREAVINVKGLSPDNFQDIMKAAVHQQQLATFRESLDEVIKQYEKEISKRLGVSPQQAVANKRKRKPSNKPAKKIEVKEG